MAAMLSHCDSIVKPDFRQVSRAFDLSGFVARNLPGCHMASATPGAMESEDQSYLASFFISLSNGCSLN
jgi:hypothetical protein